MKPSNAFIVSLIAGLLVTGLIMLVDNRLEHTGSLPQPLPEAGHVPEAQMRALDLIYDSSSLVGKYGVAVLGALGFLLSKRIASTNRGAALDRWEIAFVSISAFCAIMAIYFGVRTPLSLANQLNQNVLELSPTGDVRLTMKFQVRCLLAGLVFLWGYVFYQMMAKRPVAG